jgi:hypothetical protein
MVKKKIPYPNDKWFETEELDETLQVINYEVDGKRKEVAFLFVAKSNKHMQAITARHQKKNDIGLTVTDQDGLNFDTILESVRYGADKKKLTVEQLKAIQKNKKDGLYNKMLLHALRQSGLSQDDIDDEKN